MSDEMDMLPPEVAEAMNALYAFAGRTVDPTPCGIPMQGACLTIRDYLHRVTAEHAELSRGYEKWKRSAESVGDDLRALRQRAEHAEAELAEALAELAKLRARIAEAPTGFWTAAMPAYVCLPSDWIPIVTKWHDLDRVRLVVEDGDNA